MGAKRGPKGPLSDQHKAAMQQGRVEGRTVRQYLEALQGETRVDRKSAADVRQRLEQMMRDSTNSDPLTQLKLVQERLDLEDLLTRLERQRSADDLEEEFVRVARSYSERQGISYRAWREVGVPASVLARAGVTRAAKAS